MDDDFVYDFYAAAAEAQTEEADFTHLPIVQVSTCCSCDHGKSSRQMQYCISGVLSQYQRYCYASVNPEVTQVRDDEYWWNAAGDAGSSDDESEDPNAEDW